MADSQELSQEQIDSLIADLQARKAAVAERELTPLEQVEALIAAAERAESRDQRFPSQSTETHAHVIAALRGLIDVVKEKSADAGATASDGGVVETAEGHE